MEKPLSFKEALSLAKKHMAEGQRKKAIERLAVVQSSSKRKQDQQAAAAKRKLFAEQFLMAMSFQQYQEAKNLLQAGRPSECIQEVDSVGAGDFDNILISKLRADCAKALFQYETAQKNFQQVLEYVPNDFEANLGLSEVFYEQKKLEQALASLQSFQGKKSDEIEKYVLLKTRVLFTLGKEGEASDLLREDIERHLDHFHVIYELADTFLKTPGADWQARKYLLLFISRCKRFQEQELQKRGLTKKLEQAQASLEKVNAKLNVH